jgi:hypothetical protein
VTAWTAPDRDILQRIIFQLQRPDSRIRAPLSGGSPDGEWHTCNGTTDLAADSLAALLDELDWFQAT